MPFITVRGFLGKEPKMTEKDGYITARVGLAHTYQRGNDNQPEITEWYNLRIGSKLTENGNSMAERFLEECNKSDMVEVTGRLFKFIPEGEQNSLHGIDVLDYTKCAYTKKEAPMAPER